jgi:hypothetical protein
MTAFLNEIDESFFGMFGILVSFSSTPSELLGKVLKFIKIAQKKKFFTRLHDFSAIKKGLLGAAIKFSEVFEALPKEPQRNRR